MPSWRGKGQQYFLPLSIPQAIQEFVARNGHLRQEQGSLRTYNVTLWCVRASTVGMKTQQCVLCTLIGYNNTVILSDPPVYVERTYVFTWNPLSNESGLLSSQPFTRPPSVNLHGHPRWCLRAGRASQTQRRFPRLCERDWRRHFLKGTPSGREIDIQAIKAHMESRDIAQLFFLKPRR